MANKDLSEKVKQEPVKISTAQSSSQVWLVDQNRMLYFDFGRLERTLSWAVLGGGWQQHKGCVWVKVSDDDLRPPIEPRDFLAKKIDRVQDRRWLGLLTSAELDDYVDQVLEYGDIKVRTVLTVGLGNALHVGELPGPSGKIGTINIVTQISQSLTEGAMVEAIALQAEAKAAALLKMQIPSSRSFALATGTGTDCHVVSSPNGKVLEKYAGKHTSIGHLIGESVYQAMTQGIRRWLNRFPDHPLVAKQEGLL